MNRLINIALAFVVILFLSVVETVPDRNFNEEEDIFNLINKKGNEDVTTSPDDTVQQKPAIPLTCPKHIKSFSLGPHQQCYYACAVQGATPMRKCCARGQTYWAKKQTCVDTVGRDLGTSDETRSSRDRKRRQVSSNAMSSDLQTMVEPVLGRSVYLGCLYDAGRSLIMESDSLWNSGTIEANKRRHNAMSSHVSFSDARTSYQRVKRSKASENTKLQVLGDTIEVSGSASYLKDHIDSEKTSAYTISTHFTTHTDTLPSTTPPDHPQICNLIGRATHVVTSLTYGMDAYLTLMKGIGERESREQVEDKLREAARRIPAMARGGGGGHFDTWLKEFTLALYVSMRSDVILAVPPTTYGGSVTSFGNLSKHLGQAPHFNLAKEMKMTLTPITRFCNGSTPLFDISDSVLQQTTSMLGSMEGSLLSLSSLSHVVDVQKTSHLSHVVTMVKNKLQSFQQTIKADIKKVIPKVRRGEDGSGEHDVISLLNRYQSSPLYDVKLKRFLHAKMAELQTVEQILDWNDLKKNNITVLDTEETTNKLFLLMKPTTVMVQFNILSPPSHVTDYLSGKTHSSPTPSWMTDDVTIEMMGRTLKSFNQFASTNGRDDGCGFFFRKNFVGNKTIAVYAQKDGKVLTDNFVFPQTPEAIKNIETEYNSITIMTSRPENKWVTGFLLTQQIGGDARTVTEFQFTDDGRYKLSGFLPHTEVQLWMQYVTEVGVSAPGPSVTVVTSACSPPEGLRVEGVEESSFDVVWESPSQMANGDRVDSYEVVITFESPGTGRFYTPVVRPTVPPTVPPTTLPPAFHYEELVSGRCHELLSLDDCQKVADGRDMRLYHSTTSSRPSACYIHMNAVYYNHYSSYYDRCSTNYICQCKKAYSSYATQQPETTWQPDPTASTVQVFDDIRFTRPTMGQESNGTTIYGHVEFWSSGVWRAVCSIHFDDADANVLCTMGGFQGGLYSSGRYNQYHVRQASISNTWFHCNGTEEHVANCSKTWRHYCGSSVGIKCYFQPESSTPPPPTTTTTTTTEPIKEDIAPEPTEWAITDVTPNTNGGTIVRRRNVDGDRTSVKFIATSPATKYHISVRAIVQGKGSEESSVTIMTSPSAPSQPILLNISYHSSIVKWFPPKHIYSDDVITEYVVKYALLRGEGGGRVEEGGRVEVRSAGNHTHFTAAHLKQGRSYSVSVKAVTTTGSSGYSLPLIVETLSSEREGKDEESIKEMLQTEIQKSMSTKMAVLKSDLDGKRQNDTKLMKKMGDEVEQCNVAISSLQSTLHNETLRMQRLEDKVDRYSSTSARIQDNHSNSAVNIAGGWNMTDINRRLTELDKNQKFAFQFYYPKYGYRYIGLGYYKTNTKSTKNTNLTPEQCLARCALTRPTPVESGIWYKPSDKSCGCTEGDTGHTSSDQYLHFRYEE